MSSLDLSLGQRLAIGFGILLILLLGLFGAFVYEGQRADAIREQLASDIAPRAQAAGTLQTALLRQSVALRSYAFTRDDRFRQDFEQATQQARTSLGQLQR